MSEAPSETNDDPAESQVATTQTVEALVRRQLAQAMGGRRGMIEAAIPTLLFTIFWLSTRDLKLALIISVASALVLLVVRLVQRSTVQFVVNALFGIGLGALFAWRSAAAGGSVNDQALAYFLPGIWYNAGYALVLAFTCIIGWPLVGFMVGSVTGDPTGWREDLPVRRLCSALTWMLAAPCILRVAVQAPIWLAGKTGRVDPDFAVAALGMLKIGLGWPLQIATLAGMAWLLARNHTPLDSGASTSTA